MNLGICELLPQFPIQDAQRLYDAATQLRPRYWRLMAAWNLIAPTRTGRDWSTIDRCLEPILALGCDVVMVIGQARPSWTNSAADYGTFCGEVVERYRDRVSVWELWNEPNQRDYWGGDPDPKAYTDYVRAAHPRIKAAQPESTVLLAGMQHITRNPWADQWRWAGIPEITFLRECYAHVPNFGDYFDAAATHVYPQSETYGFLGPQPDMQLDNLQQLVEINQLTGKPVWVTEAGYWTTEGLTAEKQAEYLPALIDLLGGLHFVPAVIVYNLRDSAVSAGRQDNCGLLKVDYTPKPAFNKLTKGDILISRRNLDFLWSILLPRDDKPYGYGGRWARDDVNVTTDCSGIVSNVLEALVRGPEGFDWDREPYSTESWRVVPVGGTGPFGTICVNSPDDIPADAAVAIGCSHGGGGPNSHMACTVFHPELGKVNIESSGSNGQQVGPPARGYRDPSFSDWHYLPGPFEKADPNMPQRPDFNEYSMWSPNASSRGGKKVDLFLLHTQEGPGNADSLARYLQGNDVSYHYTISEDPNDHGVTVVDVVDTDKYSWSALSANSRSINLCFAGSRAAWTRAEWLKQSRAIDVAAYLAVQDCKKYGIPTKVLTPPYNSNPPGISDHKYVTQWLKDGSHTDVGNNFPWDVFTAAVNKYANPGEKPLPEKQFPKDLTDRELLEYIADQLGPGHDAWGEDGDLGRNAKGQRRTFRAGISAMMRKLGA